MADTKTVLTRHTPHWAERLSLSLHEPLVFKSKWFFGTVSALEIVLFVVRLVGGTFAVAEFLLAVVFAGMTYGVVQLEDLISARWVTTVTTKEAGSTVRIRNAIVEESDKSALEPALTARLVRLLDAVALEMEDLSREARTTNAQMHKVSKAEEKELKVKLEDIMRRMDERVGIAESLLEEVKKYAWNVRDARLKGESVPELQKTPSSLTEEIQVLKERNAAWESRK